MSLCKHHLKTIAKTDGPIYIFRDFNSVIREILTLQGLEPEDKKPFKRKNPKPAKHEETEITVPLKHQEKTEITVLPYIKLLYCEDCKNFYRGI